MKDDHRVEKASMKGMYHGGGLGLYWCVTASGPDHEVYMWNSLKTASILLYICRYIYTVAIEAYVFIFILS